MAFNPSEFIYNPNEQIARDQMSQRQSEVFMRNEQNAYQTREDRRRYDREESFKRDDEENRRREFDRSASIQEGQLGLQQERFGLEQQKHEEQRRKDIVETTSRAFSEASSAEEMEAIAQLTSYQYGIGFRPAPGAAGAGGLAPAQPVAAPPQLHESVMDAAHRLELAAQAFGQPPAPGDELPMQEQLPENPLEEKPNADMYDELGSVRNTGLSRKEMGAATHMIVDKYVDKTQLFEKLKNVVPFANIEEQSSAERNMEMAESLRSRSLELQAMNLTPEQMWNAQALANEVHGEPPPPPLPSMQTGMPGPMGAMPMQAPMQPLPPQALALASAPPNVPVSVIEDGRQHGALEMFDVKTGAPIATIDWQSVKAQKQQKLRTQFEPLLQGLDSQEDYKRFSGAIDSYVTTGDPKALDILHWLMQRDSAEANGLSMKDQMMMQLRDNNDKRQERKTDNDAMKTALRHLDSETAKFNKNYDVVGLNKKLADIDKNLGIIDVNSSMSQRTAASGLITSMFGKAASNAEKEFMLSAGLQNKIQEVANYLGNGGKLTDDQVGQMKDLMKQIKTASSKYRVTLAKRLKHNLKSSPSARVFGDQVGWTDKEYDKFAEERVSNLMEGGIAPTVEEESLSEEPELKPEDL